MSNASLKEQLQTLGLSSPSMPNNKRKTHPQQDKKNPKLQKPAWLEQAQYGVELLKAHFPACFKDPKEIQPLKIGIKQDLVKRLSSFTDIVISDKACMVNSLAYYVNSPSYHKRVVEGAIRIDLDGQSAGAISAEEAQYSLNCRKAKLEKKNSAEKKTAVKETEIA